MERSVPSSIDYSNVLPQAIPAIARRRKFYPQNGTSFNFAGSREIRIEIGSVNSLMDASHSYFEFTIENTGAQTFGIDMGGGNCMFKSMRVEQGGRVLTEIQEYNILHSGILNPTQDSFDGQVTSSIINLQRAFNGVGAGPAAITATAAVGQDSTVYGNVRHNSDTMLSAAGGAAPSYTFSIPLMTGLFTQDKLIPLPLVASHSPITIVYEIDNSANVGVWGAAPGAGDLSIINAAINAQLIEVGRDALDQIRSVRDMSGGQLAISGQDFEYSSDQIPVATVGDFIARLPARKRSIKSLLFNIQSSTFANGGAGMAADNVYNLSYAGCANMESYQLKVGGMVFPPTAISAFQAQGVAVEGELNRGECVMELAKALGTLAFRNPTGRLNTLTYGVAGNGISGITNGDTGDGAGNTIAPGTNEVMVACPFGLDLEAYQHTAIQSGIDTQTLSQESNLILSIGPGGGGIIGSGLQPKTINMYVLYDQHYYFGMDGMITFSN
tara:strand:- start:216 stop:1709 length:1494 start_codon:yes stop_codon:yes gene_type:complete